MSDPKDTARVMTALGLFSSCIKSGESWSPACEVALKEAKESLVRLAGTTHLNETYTNKVARLMTEITERQQELTRLVLFDPRVGVPGPIKH